MGVRPHGDPGKWAPVLGHVTREGGMPWNLAPLATQLGSGDETSEVTEVPWAPPTSAAWPPAVPPNGQLTRPIYTDLSVHHTSGGEASRWRLSKPGWCLL